MKKMSLRILTTILCGTVLMYGCSKTDDAASSKQNNSLPEFTLPNGQHYYGCLFQPASEIAKLPHYHETNAKLIAGLAPSVTLAHPPVGDQGQQGSCTGWGAATTDAIYYYYKAGLTSWSTATDVMSASFVYNKIKVGNCNSGSYVSSAVSYLKSTGDCVLADMAYTDKSCSAKPSTTATADALTHEISSYTSITPSDITTIKAALSANHPVIIGIDVDNKFEGLNSSKYTWKPNNSTVLGGHCNTIYGYDDTKGVFLVQNQWGTSWGNAGLYYISYTMFTSSNSRIEEAYSVQ